MTLRSAARSPRNISAGPRHEAPGAQTTVSPVWVEYGNRISLALHRPFVMPPEPIEGRDIAKRQKWSHERPATRKRSGRKFADSLYAGRPATLHAPLGAWVNALILSKT